MGPHEGGFADFDNGFGLVQIGHGFVVIGPGDEAVLVQFLGAPGIDLGQLQRGAGVGQFSFGLHDIGLISGRLELGDDLAIGHLRVEVHVDFPDGA